MIYTYILPLGITAYLSVLVALAGLIGFRLKKRKIYYKIHRVAGIVAIAAATIHGILALIFYLG